MDNNTFLKLYTTFNDVIFYDHNHSYCHIKDNKRYTSVTTFIGKYKEKFDSQAHSLRISQKEGETRTQEEILTEWKETADLACTKGTNFHNFGENYTQNKVFPNEVSKNLRNQFIRFYENFLEKGNVVVRPEFLVYDEEYEIAGQVDLFAFNIEKGYFYILDHKTNKKLRKYSEFNKTMKTPISHLDECEMNTYALQLSLYRHIIEKNIGVKLGESFILWFHEDNANCKVYKVPYLEKEIKDMLNDYKNN